ncbi:MAG: DUF1616 domain-containing protein [Oscillochloridaceae bacterium]|nr:DUF1616 domain-containing protein [Chloroflexaceae bacterium]MDW8389028.1 DUF1616 domain-containing protein [Oscillochloridaceae bacterium]
MNTLLTRRPGPLFIPALVGLSATLAMLLAASNVQAPALRAPLGLMLACFAPGYAVLFALFPREAHHLQQAALSIPLSLALGILVGAGMDLAALPFSGVLFAALSWGITITGLVIGAWRLERSGGAAGGFFRQAPDGAAPARQPGRLLTGALAAALVILSAGWAGSAVYRAAQVETKPFTVLAIEPARIDGAVRQAVVVANHEHAPVAYRLEVRLPDGNVIGAWAGTLPPGQTYRIPLPERLDLGASRRAEVLLFRDQENKPYRTVHLVGN